MTKERIIKLLLSTKRDGMASLLTWMEINGFFTSPCSTQHHLSCEGGLAEHSLNVWNLMTDMADTLLSEEERKEMYQSIIICSLLHDIGKAGQFGKPGYVENYLSKRDKDGNPIRSEAKPYVANAELLNVPHEIRALSIISKFIDLTEEEQHAILFHNGKYTHVGYDLKETPLQMMLHFADLWCSRVVEVKDAE